MTLKLESLDHLVLTVADIAASCAFYMDVLGMEVEVFYPADGSERRALRFGRMKINLHEVGSEFAPHAATPRAGSGDLCFLTASALDDWAVHFDACGVVVEQGPVARSGAQGAIRSLYVRDPDGNLIEVSVGV